MLSRRRETYERSCTYKQATTRDIGGDFNVPGTKSSKGFGDDLQRLFLLAGHVPRPSLSLDNARREGHREDSSLGQTIKSPSHSVEAESSPDPEVIEFLAEHSS